MAKQVSAYVKLQLQAGQANPAPLGPSLGSKGVNIVNFCKQFNERTQSSPQMMLPVVVSVYGDRSFDFVVKTPLTSALVLDAAKIKKGSAQSNREKVGMITRIQAEEIAKIKLPDLNCFTLSSATEQVIGTARSMGIRVEEK